MFHVTRPQQQGDQLKTDLRSASIMIRILEGAALRILDRAPTYGPRAEE